MKLEDIQQGASIPGDCGAPADQPPPWLDLEKFNRGRAFFLKHISAICMALHCSLTVGFSSVNLLDPLVFTNNSDTPRKARKRYTQTFVHLVLWHIGMVWDGDKDEAFKSIQRVRNMHKRVGENMNKALPGERLYVSQYDMALVQCGFFAAVVLYPETWGIQCSKKELEDYIHLWRGFGYLLGIDDRFNVCNDGTYEATYAICKEIETKVVIPSLVDPPKNFAPMADAYVMGMDEYVGFRLHSKEAIIAFNYETGGLEVPKLGFADTLRVWFLKTITFMMRYVPGVERLVNRSAMAFFRGSVPLIRGASPY